jgi:hypothetical protein
VHPHETISRARVTRTIEIYKNQEKGNFIIFHHSKFHFLMVLKCYKDNGKQCKYITKSHHIAMYM